MNHAPAVREPDRVADFLENGEKAGERIPGPLAGTAPGDDLEDLSQRRPLDHFHGVENLIVFIDAQFVEGHDIRMFELAGNLRFLDEAHQCLRPGIRQHHFHRDGAPRRRLVGIEDRAHSALGNEAADLVLSLAQKLRRKGAAHDGSLGREREVIVALHFFTMRFDDGFPDLDFLIRPDPHAILDDPTVDENTVFGAEVLDQQLAKIDRKLRVPGGNPVAFHDNIGVLPGADDIVPRRDSAPQDFDALHANDNQCLGNQHIQLEDVKNCYSGRNHQKVRPQSDLQGACWNFEDCRQAPGEIQAHP